jgi:hypothetical protein
MSVMYEVLCEKGESVVVGEDRGPYRVLQVTILEVVNGRVRLGFSVEGDIVSSPWHLNNENDLQVVDEAGDIPPCESGLASSQQIPTVLQPAIGQPRWASRRKNVS